jgi:flagellar biosynthetic protein FlhB
MAGFESGDRTEQPTARRREELRRRGQIARSGDLTSAALVLAAAAAMNFFGRDLTVTLAGILRKGLSAPAWTEIDIAALAGQVQSLARMAGQALLPVLALVTVAAIAVNLAQVGFLLTTGTLTLNFGRLNPMAGWQRMFSWSGAATLTAGLLKLSTVAAILAGFLIGQMPQLLSACRLDPGSLGRQTGSWLISLGFQLAIGLVVLAAVDYGYQLWKYERDNRMTKQELRDELRQTEGDPQVRQRRRDVHRRIVARD